jgi:hypothetical protein
MNYPYSNEFSLKDLAVLGVDVTKNHAGEACGMRGKMVKLGKLKAEIQSHDRGATDHGPRLGHRKTESRKQKSERGKQKANAGGIGGDCRSDR